MSQSTQPKVYTAPRPNWRYILLRIPMIYIASLISALAITLFLVPAQLAPGGISGVGILLDALTGFPIALTVLIGNIVLLSVGYRQLGGWNTVIITAVFVVMYSLNIELTLSFVPPEGISDDRLLNALYGGIVGGISGGIIYRMGGTLGGTSVISRILQTRFGIPTSTAYLYVDSVIILSAGYIFGWEASLFSLVVLVVNGFVADYVLEGPSNIRIVTIITDSPVAVSNAV
ncbi:MAG: YitT family protein [Chloroflexota bacterium]